MRINIINNDLSHVHRWCQHNHMSINSDKSNVMFISSRQHRRFSTIWYRNSISWFSN